jgi:hypothetical protein
METTLRRPCQDLTEESVTTLRTTAWSGPALQNCGNCYALAAAKRSATSSQLKTFQTALT